MATVGVVNFGDKINVLQQSSIDNISDESNKRQIIFVRKNAETSNSDILLTNNSTKKRISSGKTMTRIHNPPPVAVARRNARERNRVKQVNNGFATLRQHIPTAIAAAYESGNGRGSNKKLSKVETLRMAVEYIKSLEKLLNLSEDEPLMISNNDISNISTSSPTTNYNTSTSSISPVSSQYSLNYSYSSIKEEEEIRYQSHQNRKTNYHMMYEDEENIHPLKMEEMDEEILRDSNLVNTNINLTDNHDISMLHSIDNTASLSPEVYSEHSLSPAGLDPSDSKSFIPVFNVPNNQTLLPSFSQIAYDRLPQVKSELLSPNTHQVTVEEDLHSTSEAQTVCIITRNDVVNENDILWWAPTQQAH